MTETTNTILTIIAIGTMIVMPISFWLDARSSLLQPYYGSDEGNKLFRDKYGYFGKSSVIKYALIASGLLIASIFVWLYVPADFKAVSVILICGLSILLPLAHGINNPKINRNSRVQQLAEMNELSGIVASGGDTEQFWRKHTAIIFASGRVRIKLFGWIYRDGVSNITLGTALWEIRKEIERLSQRPKTEWFPK